MQMTAVILDWDAMSESDRFLLQMSHNPTILRAIAGATLREGSYTTYQLQAGSPDDVFRVLNIAHPEDYQLRSMSVGDIAVGENGKAWLCAPTGWLEVQAEWGQRAIVQA